MAQLKDLRAEIARLADKALDAHGGCAAGKIGHETTLYVQFDTSLATPGLRISVTHYATTILEAAIRPQGLVDGQTRLYSLTVNNGGFRSMVTYARLGKLLEAFGVGLGRREGRAAEQGDRLYALNHHWNVAFHRSATLWFHDGGGFDDMRQNEGRAYPDAEEIAALDWLRALIVAKDPEAAPILAETYRAARANAQGHMGYPPADTEARADYLYGRHVSADYLLTTFNGMRRSCFAQHYGKPESRAALDFLLSQWREAGAPDPAKARRHRFPQEA